VVTSAPDANGNITVTDPNGTQYRLNVFNETLPPIDGTIAETLPDGTIVNAPQGLFSFPVTVTLANGGSRTDPVSLQFLPGNLFSISANLLTGPISCTSVPRRGNL
jgi:hypothetical protein